MLEHTKKHHTDNEMVMLHLLVHRVNAERVRSYAKAIEASETIEARPWREVFQELRPHDTIGAASLRGARDKQGITQARLSEITGIPQRHISEMEHGKRPIGKEIAKKLAQALCCDYRIFR